MSIFAYSFLAFLGLIFPVLGELWFPYPFISTLLVESTPYLGEFESLSCRINFKIAVLLLFYRPIMSRLLNTM
jgi:hypothetical protein